MVVQYFFTNKCLFILQLAKPNWKLKRVSVIFRDLYTTPTCLHTSINPTFIPFPSGNKNGLAAPRTSGLQCRNKRETMGPPLSLRRNYCLPHHVASVSGSIRIDSRPAFQQFEVEGLLSTRPWVGQTDRRQLFYMSFPRGLWNWQIVR